MRADIVLLQIAMLCASAGLLFQVAFNRRQIKINEAVQEQITALVDALRAVTLDSLAASLPDGKRAGKQN